MDSDFSSRILSFSAAEPGSKLLEVNPWEWLSDVLVRVNVASEDTPVSLLPMHWIKKLVG
jgi:hypothetical protein